MATDEVAKKRRFRVRPLGCVLAAVIVFIIAPSVAMFGYHFYWSMRAREMLADLRARGEPTSAAELDEYDSLPPDMVDTAPLWLEATEPLQTDECAESAGDLPIVGTGREPVPSRGEPWPMESRAEQHLARYGESLNQLHDAATIRSPGRYPLNLFEELAGSMEHLLALRKGARLLELEAVLRVRQGDGEGAADSLHAIFMAGESLACEPTLISQLTRCGIITIGVSTLDEALPNADFSDQDLVRLKTDLEDIETREGLQLALRGERVLGIETFRNPRILSKEMTRDTAAKIWRTRQDDLAFYLECMEGYQVAAEKPWPQAMQEAVAIEQAIADEAYSITGRFRFIFTNLLASVLSMPFIGGARTDAQCRLAETALAIELYRRNNGRTPESLQQLVPEYLSHVPIDPFDGSPLRYKRFKNGYVVYSVSRDGRDDGGEQDEESDSPDLVFTVPSD
jgi:hypothetical protein